MATRPQARRLRPLVDTVAIRCAPHASSNPPCRRLARRTVSHHGITEELRSPAGLSVSYKRLNNFTMSCVQTAKQLAATSPRGAAAAQPAPRRRPARRCVRRARLARHRHLVGGAQHLHGRPAHSAGARWPGRRPTASRRAVRTCGRVWSSLRGKKRGATLSSSRAPMLPHGQL
jgi:hypothetical protein